MASLTITDTWVFPPGTTVGAYPVGGWSQASLPPSAAPPGAATASGVMGVGGMTLDGLADDARYFLGGQVGGAWRYVSAHTADVPYTPLGSGDAQHIYVDTTPHLLDLRSGTAGNPDVSLGPLAKFTRTVEIAQSAITGDGGEQLAAVSGVAVGTVACEAQPVGGQFGAKTASTAAVANNDACGIISDGRALAGATGSGIGATLRGRRDSDAGRALGVELHVYNGGATDGVYQAAGASDLKAAWINAAGNADSAVAFQIGNAFGRQFLYGYTGNGQVFGGKTGGVKLAFIRDDTSAAVSIDIRGAHSKAAILTATGTGPVVLGSATPDATDPRVNPSAQLELQAPAGTYDPLIGYHVPGNTSSWSMRLSNGNAGLKHFVAGGAAFLTGVAAGDVGVQITTSGKTWHVGTAGGSSLLRVNNTGIGFQASAPIAKPTVSGAKASNAALGSLLTALASYGLITDSTTA